MRALFSCQLSFPSLHVGRPNLPLFSFIYLFPFCSTLTPEDHSPPASHVSKEPTRPFYLFLLKTSASSSIVFSVQTHAFKTGFQHDLIISTAVLNALAKFGELSSARKLFDEMPITDAASWNAMLSGYVRNGFYLKARLLHQLMCSSCARPNSLTLSILLQLSSNLDAQMLGRSIHGYAFRHLELKDTFLCNSLIVYYNKFDDFKASERVFENMTMRDIVSWNTMISGYMTSSSPWKSLELLRILRNEFLHPDLITLEIALQSCSRIGNHITVLWNSMLSVYLHHGYFSEAVELIGKEFFYDAVSIVNILSLCISKLGLKAGKAVHGFTIRNKFESDVFVSTSLLELYITYGILHSASKIFSVMSCRNIVSWNTMIIGWARLGIPWASLKLFYDMQQKDGFMPDATSVVGAIEAISHRGIENERKFIHNYAIKNGFIDNDFVATSLMSMHSRFHNFSKADLVFDRARKLSIVTWNAMIGEYAHHGLMDNVFSAFHQMKINGAAPDSVTMLCLLQGCIAAASLNGVTLVHATICKSGYDSDVYVGSALINAYSKCGELSMAWQVFDNMVLKTIVSWNSMILGYGIHGEMQEASKLFLQMQDSGLHPSAVTFLVLISSCSYTGYMEKGLYYLDLMTKAYSLNPSDEHLSSFIGLLGRSGLVKEANELLEKMPKDPGVFAWGAFVGACRVQGNLELALTAAQKLFRMSPMHQGYQTLLPNILAESGRWMEASIIRSKADEAGFRKEKARSMVETLV